MELYRETGIAKIPACVEYIRDMIKQGNKFLVFAHHIAMLDAIERALMDSKTGSYPLLAIPRLATLLS